MTFQMRSAIALLLVTAVVTACGGALATPASTQASTAGATQAGASADATGAIAATDRRGAINACAVITEQEATALLGSDPGPGQDTSGDMGPACAYGASLTLNVGANAGKARFDGDKSAAQGSATFQNVSGVGDAAFVSIVANTIGQMEILKGSTVLTVNVQGNPALQNITPASMATLGTAAAGRI